MGAGISITASVRLAGTIDGKADTLLASEVWLTGNGESVAAALDDLSAEFQLAAKASLNSSLMEVR